MPKTEMTSAVAGAADTYAQLGMTSSCLQPGPWLGDHVVLAPTAALSRCRENPSQDLCQGSGKRRQAVSSPQPVPNRPTASQTPMTLFCCPSNVRTRRPARCRWRVRLGPGSPLPAAPRAVPTTLVEDQECLYRFPSYSSGSLPRFSGESASTTSLDSTARSLDDHRL